MDNLDREVIAGVCVEIECCEQYPTRSAITIKSWNAALLLCIIKRIDDPVESKKRSDTNDNLCMLSPMQHLPEGAEVAGGAPDSLSDAGHQNGQSEL